MKPSRTPWLVLASAALLLGVGSAVAAPTYRLTSLGTLGGSSSIGSAINNAGQVAGTSYLAGSSEPRAFLFDGSGLVDLGTLGGSQSVAYAINDAGQVTGWANPVGSSRQRVALWTSGGTIDLGSPGSPWSPMGIGWAINSSSQVAGVSGDQAFLTGVGTVTSLGTLGGSYSAAYGLNDSGQVTGAASLFGNLAAHAFVYAGGVMTDLGTLGGETSVGQAINEAGAVTGWSAVADGHARAYVSANGSMLDLGALGGSYSYGQDINNAGQVVGLFRTADDSADHGFLYSDGVMYDLNDLIDPETDEGWTVIGAQGINESGQIVANGVKNGFTYALLLTPISEPGTAVLASVALAALGLGRRRRHALPAVH